MKKAVILLVALSFICGCSKKEAEMDTEPPKVVATNPVNGSVDVDSSLTEISVTFNEEMMDACSWCMENKDSFPEMTGTPSYTEGNTKNIVPVKLESGKEYVIWINTSQYTNFKDKAGNSADPYKFTFKTK